MLPTQTDSVAVGNDGDEKTENKIQDRSAIRAYYRHNDISSTTDGHHNRRYRDTTTETLCVTNWRDGMREIKT